MDLQLRTNKYGPLFFSLACLRRVIPITKDHRITNRLHELEKVAEKQLSPESLIDCKIKADQRTPRGKVDHHLAEALNNALWLSQRSPPMEHEPISVREDDRMWLAFEVARQVRLVVGFHQCPERYWSEFELPPELEPFRGPLHNQEFHRTVRRFPEENRDAYTAWTILWQAQEQANKNREQAEAEEEKIQCDLFRDIFRYPFDSPLFSPEWRTSTVLSIAQKIYDERTFDGLPILADALEEAGCDDTELLTHCRSSRPRVWGCWALDLILGYRRDELSAKSTP
jgi:hypothetical protein